ncbi:MAG TPA: uridine diphosphate-N-acetylglucosamine-binding protein YvcK, partial [Beutenbergiaceae bacterium]|nr:uridine diphosphate-N-acetylglucosamine-binding protein YvcK [Beutenbergiaceae bacterium]
MSRSHQRPLKVVALGGGHGLAASLQALRHVTADITAVVTVADDGGSSGRLRQELDVLPPGDLRMALAALCAQSDWGVTWRDVLQHRFSSAGPLNGHAVGNLLIVALWELLGDPVAGLELIGELLGAEGRVIPMAAVPLEIEADVSHDGWANSQTIRGQSRVAVTSGHVHKLRLQPPDAPARPEAIEAIHEADWVILGPGSWYTSVLTHLLVPGLAHALRTSTAKVGLTLNLASQPGETGGFSAADHVRVFQQYAPEQRIDTVIADPSAVEDLDDLNDTAKGVGARVLYR